MEFRKLEFRNVQTDPSRHQFTGMETILLVPAPVLPLTSCPRAPGWIWPMEMDFLGWPLDTSLSRDSRASLRSRDLKLHTRGCYLDTWPVPRPPAVSAGPARGRGGLLGSVAGEGDGGGEVAGPGRRAALLQHGSIRSAEAAISNYIPRRGNKYFYSQIFY